MKKIYRSRVSVGLCVFVYGLILICFCPMFFDFNWGVFTMLVLVLFFVTWLLLGIRYVIDGDELIVKHLITNRFDIKKLMSIKRSQSLLSSPAASLDRIELRFSKPRLSLLISPRNQKEVIHDLITVNPNIEVEEVK